MTTLRQTGERALIRRLAPLLQTRPDVVTGIGDDAAVVRVENSPWDWVLTSDAVIEGRHFLPDTRPEQVGHKAIGRCLSDLAAMGAEPLWALVDVVASPSARVQELEALYRGLAALAGKYSLAIVGGDTTESDRLEIHAFAVGRVPAGKAVLRSGAQPGERVYVTGTLGGSRLGRHLAFEPRIAEGLWLREWAGAMIDLSDGLATDAHHVLEKSAVGMELWADRIPISPEALALRDGTSPLRHALTDGEDFELLFTVKADRQAAFEDHWKKQFGTPCTGIGRITTDTGRLTLLDPHQPPQDIPSSGFEHFR